ncbi:MAG TPA: DUF5682 family protein, partial [Candidatus Methylacidiphilales bacterium]|nr:DUF5682 family protein [Candidatus Methylacidiphilales bacterium]
LADGEVLAHDPFLAIARIAGYTDTELWWDHTFERRQDSTGVFEAVLELVTELRKHAPERSPREQKRNEMREATMRQAIRAAQKEGFQRIAVVCGAWHAPALATMPAVKVDNETLKGLSKLKTGASWIPWTYERLASPFYGAGVEAPGWYHFLWKAASAKGGLATLMPGWMIRAARAFRKEGFEISSAHAIEATRLAEGLAALRSSPLPGLPEVQEAIRAVYCYGQDLPMAIVRDKLLISNRLGDVPDDVPQLPLLEDLSRKQKSLRLKPEADTKELDLDLRKENDMLRSCLLRQLKILGVSWGKLRESSGKTSTFHEYWSLKWKPEYSVDLATSGIYGNTIEDAAIGRLQSDALKEQELVKLAGYLFDALTARLDAGIEPILARVQEVAATTTDVSFLMKSLHPLARSFRYGDVRKTKAVAVEAIYDGMVERICVGFPPACSSLNDDAATEMMGYMGSVSQALELVNNEAHNKIWFNALRIVSERQGLHGLVAGRSLRMLFDQNMVNTEELGRRLGLAISIASGPVQAAQWVEGFLSRSGLLLIHHPELLRILYAWVATLDGDNFTSLLPLLRRTFGAFASSERRQIGEKVHSLAQSRGAVGGLAEAASRDGAGVSELDPNRVGLVLPVLARMLGLKPPAQSPTGDAGSVHHAATV